jgi:hypothetical protein
MDKEFWLTILAAIGFSVVALMLSAYLLNSQNPKIEKACNDNGGQVITRPGDFSSCLYPTKQ